MVVILSITSYTRAACVTADCAPPEGWDNFANNLGSDLAPLLTLFGEQVTKQYLSESLSWVDCLLFALSPLGIITAIVAAVRVAGSPWLRSVIGRAKESRGEVEADLMSSTSSDVCELWNGEGVVRVLGRPVLLQLVMCPTATTNATFNIHPTPPNAVAGPENEASISQPMGHNVNQLKPPHPSGLYTFQDAITRKLYTRADINSNQQQVEESSKSEIPPNLSWNVSINPCKPSTMVLLVLVGFAVQGAVLVFAAVSQYKLKMKKNDLELVGYGFPLFAVGTGVLGMGMFVCAMVVESATEEETWKPEQVSGEPYVIWLQQGGQTVGDQRFEAFARKSSKNILTSRNLTKHGQLARVNLGVVAALLGFFAQFIALRAMHSTVTIAQLAAVFIMTAVRSYTRMERENKNLIDHPTQVEGHELDWLAKDLQGCKVWELISGPDTVGSGSGSPPMHPSPPEGQNLNLAMTVMLTRARLADLAKDWHIERRAIVRKLRDCINATMNQVYSSSMSLKANWGSEKEVIWFLPVKVDGSSNTLDISLAIRRSFTIDNEFGPWETDEHELEAVICLSLSSVTDGNEVLGQVNIRHLGPASDKAIKDYLLWTRRVTPHHTGPLPGKSRLFGCVRGVTNTTLGGPQANTDQYLWVETKTSLEDLCAQQVYAEFIYKIATIIEEVGGVTLPRKMNPSTVTHQNLYLSNSNLSSLATIYQESGLGTIEEAYFSIIPALRSSGKIPSVYGAYRQMVSDSTQLELAGSLERAMKIDDFLYTETKSPDFDQQGIAAIIAEGEQRLCRFVEMLCKDPPKTSDEKLELWNSVYKRLQHRTEQTPARAAGLVSLYGLSEHVGLVPSKIIGGARTAIEELDIEHGNPAAIDAVLDFTQLILKEGCTADAENLATFVWHVTRSKDKRPPTPRNIRAVQILISIRLEKNRFMKLDETKNSIQDLESNDDHVHRSGATNFKLYNRGSTSSPSDLMLIQGYRTPLQAAAEAGCLDTAEYLLNEGANIADEPAADYGRTALQAAAGAGRLMMVKWLLRNGANVNASFTSNYERTAVQTAAEAGHLDIVKFLVSEKAQLNCIPSKYGRTTFQAAAGGGHLEIVRFLCDNGVNAEEQQEQEQPPRLRSLAQYDASNIHNFTKLVSERIAKTKHVGKQDQRTALQAAAESGQIGVVRLLLTKGAKLNLYALPFYGRTALQAAAGAGQSEMVDLLLENGATISAIPGYESGRTALQAAAEAGHLAIVKKLLSRNADVNAVPGSTAGRTALQAAAGSGHLGIVELLLKAGAKVDDEPTGQSGRTAMQAAAEAGHLAIVGRLLVANAKVNDNPGEVSGRTALQGAAGAGHFAMVEFLLSEGAEVNAPPSTLYGRTALQAAAEGGHLAVVRLLLAAKAAINDEPGSDSGRTALQAAAGASRFEMVQLLLREGANVNAGPTPSSGYTALQAAAGAGDLDIVTLLLAKGADIHAPPADRVGRTALQAAAEIGSSEVVEFLLRHDADVNALPSEFKGRTALQAAAGGGHLAIVLGLLRVKANINAPSAKVRGLTALQAAAENGHLEIVTTLVSHTAEVNASPGPESGRTALQAAAENGHDKIVKFLLSKGAKAHADGSPRGGISALGAAAMGHLSIVKMLLGSQESSQIPSDIQADSLARSRACGKQEIVDVLKDAFRTNKLPSNLEKHQTNT